MNKRKIQPRYLTTPLGKHYVKGFIPHSVHATDDPRKIVDYYGVSLHTARTWLRILKGPQVSMNGEIITRWEKPSF